MIFLLHFSFVFDSLTFFAQQGIRLSSGSDLAWAEISSNAGLSRHDARAVACEHWRMIADRQGPPCKIKIPRRFAASFGSVHIGRDCGASEILGGCFPELELGLAGAHADRQSVQRGFRANAVVHGSLTVLLDVFQTDRAFLQSGNRNPVRMAARLRQAVGGILISIEKTVLAIIHLLLLFP